MARDPADEGNVIDRDELLTVVVTVDAGTGATVLAVAGEVDMLTAPLLRQHLDEHFGVQAPIVVDLSRVEFFGSNGLAVVFDAQQRARLKAAISYSWLVRGSYGDRLRCPASTRCYPSTPT